MDCREREGELKLTDELPSMLLILWTDLERCNSVGECRINRDRQEGRQEGEVV